MNQALIEKLSVIMADTYTLYLKTQNYHWHVKGPHFKQLHELFEKQYQELAAAADLIAERIVTLGANTPATFKEFLQLKNIAEGNPNTVANQMLIELTDDHTALLQDLNKAMALAQKEHDEGTANMLANLIEAQEKMRWMLDASKDR